MMNRILHRNKIIITLVSLIFLSIFCCFFSLSSNNKTQYDNICINEVCSDNFNSLSDDLRKHPDWIELYNKGDFDIDLYGYALSDTRLLDKEWKFPHCVIPAKGYIVVYASGDGNETPNSSLPLLDSSFSLRAFIFSGRGISSPMNLHASFKLSSTGEELYLMDPQGRIIDFLEVPALKYDTAYGRTIDGAEKFGRLSPTPYEKNGNAKLLPDPILKDPIISAQSGFYDSPFLLSIESSEPGAQIRYTLDGSTPTISSPLYEKPLLLDNPSNQENRMASMKETSVFLYDYYDKKHYQIPKEPVDKCVCLRAAVFKGNQISNTVNRTFFIGIDPKAYSNSKLISLISDTAGLQSYENGIYVVGQKGTEHLLSRVEKNEEAKLALESDPDIPRDGSVRIGPVGFNRLTDANYMQKGREWERESYISVFNSDGSLSFEQGIGIRIRGVSSRHLPKKGLNLYARKSYDRASNGFFPDGFGAGYHESEISLSSGGNDPMTLTKDKTISLLTEKLDIATSNFGSPAILFINGEYWGEYLLSEKQDSYFFQRHFGIDPDNLVFIKENIVEEGEESDLSLYEDLVNEVAETDASTAEGFQRLEELIDIDNVIDYYSVRIYGDYGIDWPHHNVGMWRVREPDIKKNPAEGNETDSSNPYNDGRWRMVNYDMNHELHINKVSVNMIDIVLNGGDTFGPDWLFTALIKNDDFKARFKSRFMELLNTVYDPESAIPVFDSIVDEMRPLVPRGYHRWFGDYYPMSFFDEETESIRTFFRERPKIIAKYVEEACK